MSDERARLTIGATAVAVALTLGFLLGHLTASRADIQPSVLAQAGLPVAVADTQAGALAADDNDLALSSQTLEQDPTLFDRVVNELYLPAVRAQTLTDAAQMRAGDPADMNTLAGGGRAVAIIGARRLNSWTPTKATLTTWLGGVIWGPNLAPRQTWTLVNSTLQWQNGRWLLVTASPQNTPAPVPATVVVNGPNDETAAFNTRLAGMSAPFYGTGGQ